jgi:hypothetical protein
VVGAREFIIDLLFYHHPQCRFVVIELKVGEFDPEHAGKLKYVGARPNILSRLEPNRGVALSCGTTAGTARRTGPKPAWRLALRPAVPTLVMKGPGFESPRRLSLKAHG